MKTANQVIFGVSNWDIGLNGILFKWKLDKIFRLKRYYNYFKYP